MQYILLICVRSRQLKKEAGVRVLYVLVFVRPG